MDNTGKLIFENQTLSVEKADRVTSDLAYREMNGCWPSSKTPDWASELGHILGVGSANPTISSMAWRALSIAYAFAFNSCENNHGEHIIRLEQNIQHDRTELGQRCRTLSDRLIRIANHLESDKHHNELTINDLGEIQSEGTIIDALCGRLIGKIRALQGLK